MRSYATLIPYALLCSILPLVSIYTPPVFCSGAVLMSVGQYPARIYQNAPAGVPVVKVTAYDNTTGYLTNFQLENKDDARHFKIDVDGIIRTASVINYDVGRNFEFFVYALHDQKADYKHVKIIVSERNKLAPVFSNSTYYFPVYRYGIGDIVGRVTASDNDPEPYNKKVNIYAASEQVALKYLSIDKSGTITLLHAVPESTEMLDLKVTAVDTGSPPKTGSAMVIVDVIMVKQPRTFCLSATQTTTTLCWKNPMPERAFNGYDVSVRGDISRKDFLPLISGHAEACYTLNGTLVGKQYIFRVTVRSKDFWYGDAMDIVFNKTGPGISPQCKEERFSTCSYMDPCQNEGTCMPGGTTSNTNTQAVHGSSGHVLDYSCICQGDWKGDNCTVKDACLSSPCGTNGSCVFTGHEKYRCECRDGSFGTNCEHFNGCLKAPCMHGGKCKVFENGTYTCDCPPGFAGKHCQDKDPCSPNPCVQDHSQCIRISDTVRQCQCNEGYYGERCEKADMCVLERPCLFGGKCVSTEDHTFKCECPSGRIGDRCEINDPCSNRPCRNGATCEAGTTGTYKCECLPGYYGGECQYLNSCHGIHCNNGTCITDANENGRCDCDRGYFGDFCEHYDICLTFDRACSGRGTCISSLSEGNSSSYPEIRSEYTCECLARFHGEECLESNLCYPKVCRNGGKCVHSGINQYDCICPSGRYAEDCSSDSPCYQHRCQNGAVCKASKNGMDYDCQCASEDWLGDFCQQRSPCAYNINPCQNNASCAVKETRSTGGVLIEYVADCTCLDGHTGQFCQWENPCLNSPCLHGTCFFQEQGQGHGSSLSRYPSMARNAFYCHCTPGYTGVLCDTRTNACDNVVCQNGGDCVMGKCMCPPGFAGTRCELPQQVAECVVGIPLLDKDCQCVDGKIHCAQGFECPEDEVELSTKDGVKYCVDLSNMTLARNTVLRCCNDTSECQVYSPTCDTRTHCSESGVPDTLCQYFKSMCHKDATCVQFVQEEMSCLDLAREGDRGWIECAGDKLKAIQIKDPTQLGASDVANMAQAVVDQLEAAVEKREVAQLAMNIINSLSDVNVSVSQEVEERNNTNTRLREFLDNYTAQVDLESGSVTMQTTGFVVMATTIDAFSDDEIIFEPSIGNTDAMRGVSIYLPKTILEQSAMNYNNISKASRLQFIGYTKSQLFTPKYGGNDVIELDGSVINRQRVVSASVAGVSLEDLEEPVRIILPAIEVGTNHTCVFWDEKNSSWSQQGVRTVYDAKTGMFTCLSDHLTSFAVLMSPTPSSLKSEIGLSYITYIGSGISVACLLLTILTYGLFKCLHGEKSGKILLHLCTSLLLLNVVFLLSSVDVSDFSDNVCKGIALLLHYLVLSTLWWMLVEAVEMYRAIVTVFTKYERYYLIKRCLIGWGIPAIIVIVTASIDLDFYGSNTVDNKGHSATKICFLTPGEDNIAYYASLLGPACLIVLINTIVFILVVRVILKPRFQQQISSNTAPFTPAQVRGAFTVMFLLGVTWIFGPLAIGEAQIVFSYFFCISNSLQGFLIFVFRCLFNPECRLAWSQLYHTGTLKRRRGPIKSVYVDSSSSKEGHDTSSSATRRLSNSTNVNLTTSTNFQGNNSMKLPLYCGNSGIHAHPHQLHTTNGWHPNLNGMKRDNGYNGGGSCGSSSTSDAADLLSHILDKQTLQASMNGGSREELKPCEFSSMTKKDSLPPDPFSSFQDELTHL